MVKLNYVGIILGILLVTSCSKDNNDANDGTYDCKSLFSAEDTSRNTNKTLKGHILFSWRNNENTWNYSIVQNLNIRPADENICEGNSFTGEECLKTNFSHFAEGEEFFWIHNLNVETIEGKKISLSYPPENIIHDIQAFCESLNVELVLDN